MHISFVGAVVFLGRWFTVNATTLFLQAANTVTIRNSKY